MMNKNKILKSIILVRLIARDLFDNFMLGNWVQYIYIEFLLYLKQYLIQKFRLLRVERLPTRASEPYSFVAAWTIPFDWCWNL